MTLGEKGPEQRSSRIGTARLVQFLPLSIDLNISIGDPPANITSGSSSDVKKLQIPIPSLGKLAFSNVNPLSVLLQIPSSVPAKI